MLGFLRRIRRSLLEEGHLKKYLAYALGEILLVMIGILLALQVNAWNEDRKLDATEIEVLSGLLQDLNTDIENLQAKIKTDSLISGANLYILQLLDDQNATYHDSLSLHFGSINRYEVFSPQKFGYESLKTAGVEIIRNDSLRASIIGLYDFSYENLDLFYDILHQLYQNTNPVFLERLYTVGDLAEHKAPNDFERLKSDQVFKNYLSHVRGERNQSLVFYRIALARVKSVKEEIEKELNRLDR